MAMAISTLRTLSARALAPFILSPSEARYLDAVVAAVRVMLGLLLAHQMVDIFGFAMLAEANAGQVRLTAGLTIAATAMLTLGLLTPLAVIGLIVYFAWMPIAFNLGTQVTVVLLWALLLHGAGRAYSLDARMLKAPRLGPWLARMYAPFARPGATDIARIRLFTLTLFWGCCVSAMLYHFDDAFWHSGKVLQFAFTAPYLSDQYQLMSAFRDRLPAAFVLFCTVGLAVQAVWELFLVPLMYTRWTRLFVFVQGLGFFAASILLLNLQYLPIVELLLWTYFFGPAVLGWLGRRRPAETPEPIPGGPAPLIARWSPALVGFGLATMVLQNALAPTLWPAALASLTTRIHYKLAPGFTLFGQRPIRVFNREDIGMSTAHLVIQEVDAKGEHLRVVPFQDIEGGRLDYMRNDSLYFTHSLRWQRASWHRKFTKGDPRRPNAVTQALARRVAKLDAVLTGPERPRYYRVHVFTRAMRLDTTPPRWTEARPTASFGIALGPDELRPHTEARRLTFDLPPGQALGTERLRRTEEAIARIMPAR